jgi:peptidoglycan/LPS O-acetylase OafA/YrhL
MAFHAGVSWLPGGFLGVDAFFVLSGFLITSLLLRERLATGRIALGAFWGRRARRLLPALLLVLVVVAVAGRWLLDPETVHLLRADSLAALFYVANWRMLLRGHGGYFAATASPSPLEHTWSLGIEEQFYLFWPLLLLLLLLRKARLRALIGLCLAGALASAVAAAALFHPGADPSRVYYGTDTRVQALLIGAALAAVLALRPPADLGPRRLARLSRTGAVAALAGALATGWAWTHAGGTSRWLYTGGFLAVAVATAALIAHIALAPTGGTARLLSVPPLPAIGRISYGLYLWHWPVYQAATAERTGQAGVRLLALRVAITVVVALASYLLLEQPIRRRRWPLRVAVPALTGAVAGVAAVAIAATALAYQPDGPVTAAASSQEAVRVRIPARPATGPGPLTAPVRPHHRPGTPPVIDFFGDSVAWTVGAYLPPHPGLVTHDHAMQGCGIALGDPYRYIGGLHTTFPSCKYWESVWRQRLAGDDPDVAVILLDRWELVDRVHDGRWTYVGQPAYDSYLQAQLRKAIALVSTKGASVVLLTAPYNRRGEQPDGSLYSGDLPSRVDAWNALLRRTAAGYPGTVSVVDLNKKVCPAGRFTWTVAGVRIRSDGTHFTPAGVHWLAPWLLPALARYVH